MGVLPVAEHDPVELFDYLVIVIVWAVLFFLLAVLLFPPDLPFALHFALHFAVLGLIGVFVQSRTFHVILASYILGIGLTWSLVVRRFLAA
ncbi:MAG: hypothetical protein RQ745_08765 [Longimicrobiales bacterium]|nr:hypothetical protein [Longimicrobiales bacterium]